MSTPVKEKTVQETVLPLSQQKDLPQARQLPVRPEEQTALPPLPGSSRFGFIRDFVDQLIQLVSNILFTKSQPKGRPVQSSYARFCEMVNRPKGLTHMELYRAWEKLDLGRQNQILRYYSMIFNFIEGDDLQIPSHIRAEKERLKSARWNARDIMSPTIYINALRCISVKEEWNRVALASPNDKGDTLPARFSRMHPEIQKSLATLVIYSYGPDIISAENLDFNQTPFHEIKDEDIQKVLDLKDELIVSAAIREVINWLYS